MDARENPFFPSKEAQATDSKTKIAEKCESLKPISTILPSNARVVKEITVTFIDNNGSEDKKTISIDKSIDWHKPLIISQNESTLSNKNNNSDKKIPLEVKNDSSYIELGTFMNISFYAKDKSLKINTKDEYVQNLLLVNPSRIVIDFKGNYHFQSYSKSIQGNVFKSIKIGNHDGYYRAVIELDGPYKYSFSQENGTYYFSLK